jgi:hypothetical protein
MRSRERVERPLLTSGSFLLRPEHGDGRFIRDRVLPTGAGGLVISARLVNGLESDPPHRAERVRELRALLGESRALWLYDPDTPALADPGVLTESGAAARLRDGPIGSSVPLPLRVELASDRDVTQALLESTWAQQATSAGMSAPYLRFKAGDDALQRLNVELVRRTSQADHRPAIAFVEATVGALTSGRMATLAEAYARAGARVAVLRVAGLPEQQALRRQVAAYLRTIATYKSAGLQVVADMAGRLGAVLVAGGADAFSSGSWHFRSVSRDRVPRVGGGGGSRPVLYELGRRFRAVSPDLARQLPDAQCAVAGCRALDSNASAADLREHAIHIFVAAAADAAARGPAGVLADLEGAGLSYTAEWALGLRDAMAERASL